MQTAPVLFVSHGSPVFALEPGLLGPQLTELGQRFQGIAAICVVSAHWQSPGVVEVMAAEAPTTIHDFSGFPRELYQLRYPARGAPDFAEDALKLLLKAGIEARADFSRGFDHGAWVPLRYLEPAASVPVFQVSMPQDLDAAGALALGAALAPLRARGVLIVGSGSLTHNLREVFQGANDVGYAQAFVAWIREKVATRDLRALESYRQEAPGAVRAHPTEEHFLPLLVAAGASSEADQTTLLDGGMTYGVLSMDAFFWTAPASPATPSQGN